MKHRLTIPFLDAGGFFPHVDIQGWAHSHGWYVESYEWSESRLLSRRGQQELYVKLLPVLGVFPDSRVQIRASSGATLVYDDAEQTMGVTLLPEPHDAVPPHPQDAKP
jgi:hypothetical protein